MKRVSLERQTSSSGSWEKDNKREIGWRMSYEKFLYTSNWEIADSLLSCILFHTFHKITFFSGIQWTVHYISFSSHHCFPPLFMKRPRKGIPQNIKKESGLRNHVSPPLERGVNRDFRRRNQMHRNLFFFLKETEWEWVRRTSQRVWESEFVWSFEGSTVLLKGSLFFSPEFWGLSLSRVCLLIPLPLVFLPKVTLRRRWVRKKVKNTHYSRRCRERGQWEKRTELFFSLSRSNNCTNEQKVSQTQKSKKHVSES